VYSEDLS